MSVHASTRCGPWEHESLACRRPSRTSPSRARSLAEAVACVQLSSPPTAHLLAWGAPGQGGGTGHRCRSPAAPRPGATYPGKCLSERRVRREGNTRLVLAREHVHCHGPGRAGAEQMRLEGWVSGLRPQSSAPARGLPGGASGGQLPLLAGLVGGARAPGGGAQQRRPWDPHAWTRADAQTCQFGQTDRSKLTLSTSLVNGFLQTKPQSTAKIPAN